MGDGTWCRELEHGIVTTYLNKGGLEVDFNVLGDVITAFQSLHDKYQWGTNLPYMLSGANSISQKK